MKVGDNLALGGLDTSETTMVRLLTSSTVSAVEAWRYGDSVSRMTLSDDRLLMGSGSAPHDVALVRYGVGRLQCQGDLIAALNSSSVGTERNYGLHVWTDRAFGMELHNGGGTWATAIFTRASDGEIRFGKYGANTSAQDTFQQWARFGILGGLVVGSPTGADEGGGTVNASGLYVNGSPVWHAGNFNATGHTHDAAAISSGVLATARLGGGTANSTTFLRGDGAWASVPGGLGDAPVDGVGYVRRNGAWSQSAWGYLTGTPTTLAGYGINDALALSGGTITGALALSGIGVDVNSPNFYAFLVREPGTNSVRPMSASFAKGHLNIGWNDVGSKPSTFAPSSHTHTTTDLSDVLFVGRQLMTAATASEQRSHLGLGTAAVSNVDSFLSYDGVPLNNGQPLRMRVIQNTHSTIADGLFVGYGNSNGGNTRLYGGGSTSAHVYVNGSGDLYRSDGAQYWHSGNSHTHSTADITSGVFSTARLGAGSATSATFLRGDGSWASVTETGVPFPSGSQTAGTIYVLYCSSGGSNPSFEWRILTGDNLV